MRLTASTGRYPWHAGKLSESGRDVGMDQAGMRVVRARIETAVTYLLRICMVEDRAGFQFPMADFAAGSVSAVVARNQGRLSHG